MYLHNLIYNHNGTFLLNGFKYLFINLIVYLFKYFECSFGHVPKQFFFNIKCGRSSLVSRTISELHNVFRPSNNCIFCIVLLMIG